MRASTSHDPQTATAVHEDPLVAKRSVNTDPECLGSCSDQTRTQETAASHMDTLVCVAMQKERIESTVGPGCVGEHSDQATEPTEESADPPVSLAMHGDRLANAVEPLVGQLGTPIHASAQWGRTVTIVDPEFSAPHTNPATDHDGSGVGPTDTVDPEYAGLPSPDQGMPHDTDLGLHLGQGKEDEEPAAHMDMTISAVTAIEGDIFSPAEGSTTEGNADQTNEHQTTTLVTTEIMTTITVFTEEASLGLPEQQSPQHDAFSSLGRYELPQPPDNVHPPLCPPELLPPQDHALSSFSLPQLSSHHDEPQRANFSERAPPSPRDAAGMGTEPSLSQFIDNAVAGDDNSAPEGLAELSLSQLIDNAVAGDDNFAPEGLAEQSLGQLIDNAVASDDILAPEGLAEVELSSRSQERGFLSSWMRIGWRAERVPQHDEEAEVEQRRRRIRDFLPSCLRHAYQLPYIEAQTAQPRMTRGMLTTRLKWGWAEKLPQHDNVSELEQPLGRSRRIMLGLLATMAIVALATTAIVAPGSRVEFEVLLPRFFIERAPPMQPPRLPPAKPPHHPPQLPPAPPVAPPQYPPPPLSPPQAPPAPLICTHRGHDIGNLFAEFPSGSCSSMVGSKTTCLAAYAGFQVDGVTECRTEVCAVVQPCKHNQVTNTCIPAPLVRCGAIPPQPPLPSLPPPLLPLPPSPPPPPPLEQVLQERFMNGRPDNHLERAGVIVHLFDSLENSQNRPWVPCPKGTWCYPYSDRLSASIINSDLPFFFGQKYHAGMVLSPWKTDVMCSWFIDYGTMGKRCDPPGVREDCLPGCWDGPKPNWCSGDKVWDCAYRPDQLEIMLGHHLNRLGRTSRFGRSLGAAYNELMVSWQSLTRDLPDPVEAFFFTDWKAYDLAVKAHNTFLADYPSSTAPLLRLDINNEDAIFTAKW